jgi:hypothetical protein
MQTRIWLSIRQFLKHIDDSGQTYFLIASHIRAKVHFFGRRSFYTDLKGSTGLLILSRFHPEMVFLPNFCVKLRPCLCDVLQYVSAQALVFLDLEQKSTFPIWKLRCAQPVFPDGHYLIRGSSAPGIWHLPRVQGGPAAVLGRD